MDQDTGRPSLCAERPSTRGGRPLIAAAALTAVLMLSSCFTATLWGMELVAERDPVTGETETVAVADLNADESLFDNFFVKLLLTPFTVALDCVTCPVQAWIYGFDCDEDE